MQKKIEKKLDFFYTIGNHERNFSVFCDLKESEAQGAAYRDDLKN